MRRREFLRVGLCVLTALTALPSTLAREPGTSVRIGWLSAGSMEKYRPMVDAFRQGMSDLGYVEGKSYVIDFHWGADTPKGFDAMASDIMMQNHPDIVLATCQFTSRAAINAAHGVPVVVAGGVDLLSVGLAKSLSRPGGNITGLTALSPEIAAKRLELLKEVVPRAARIAVLNEGDDANSRQALAALQPAAAALRVDLLTYDASRTSDYAKIFGDMRAARADAFLMVSAPNMFSERRALADLALRSHLPSSFPTYEFVEAGGMMSLGVDFRVLFRRSATYVDKILKGANPGELPIEQPTSFELAVNQKTAKALGVAIPQSVLVRTDRIIE